MGRRYVFYRIDLDANGAARNKQKFKSRLIQAFATTTPRKIATSNGSNSWGKASS